MSHLQKLESGTHIFVHHQFASIYLSP